MAFMVRALQSIAEKEENAEDKHVLTTSNLLSASASDLHKSKILPPSYRFMRKKILTQEM